MKTTPWIAAAFSAVLTILASSAALALEVTVEAGEFDDLLRGLNVEAQADLGAFTARLSARFGLPQAKVAAVIGTVDQPGDAFMALKVAEVSSKPVDEVVGAYKGSKEKGWGRVARELGIKPGSPEFKALKKSDLAGKGKGKGKGKGRGPKK